MATIKINDGEIKTTREAARNLNSLLTELGEGKFEKIVLMRNSRIVGVVITADTYEHETRPRQDRM